MAGQDRMVALVLGPWHKPSRQDHPQVDALDGVGQALRDIRRTPLPAFAAARKGPRPQRILQRDVVGPRAPEARGPRQVLGWPGPGGPGLTKGTGAMGTQTGCPEHQ